MSASLEGFKKLQKRERRNKRMKAIASSIREKLNSFISGIGKYLGTVLIITLLLSPATYKLYNASENKYVLFYITLFIVSFICFLSITLSNSYLDSYRGNKMEIFLKIFPRSVGIIMLGLITSITIGYLILKIIS